MSHKKSKVPHSLIQTRIQQGVRTQIEKRGNADYIHGYETGQKDLQIIVNANESSKIQQLRLTISSLESQIDQYMLTINEKDALLVKQGQSNNHQIQQILDLKHKIKQSESNLQTVRQDYVMGITCTVTDGVLVPNWRTGWKWFSNMFFTLIAFFAMTPIPDSVLAVLPDDIRMHLIAWCAICGLVSRFINQSKSIQSWPLKS